MSVNEVKLKQAVVEFDVKGTGHPGSRTFVLGNEDHTLGNALRHVLIQNSKIAFAGYSVPHPSEPLVHIRVQTAPKSRKVTGNKGNADPDDTRAHASEVLKEACETLIAQCDFVLEKIEEIMPEVKEDRLNLEKYSRETEAYHNDDDEVMDEVENEEYQEEEMGDDL